MALHIGSGNIRYAAGDISRVLARTERCEPLRETDWIEHNDANLA
jgi:hypothetical protein